MEIKIAANESLQNQAIAAGFGSLEQYIYNLLDRDAERVAIQQGIDALNEGRVISSEEVYPDIRKRLELPPTAQ
ncbi:hypothetical protein Pla110_24630 [Polystyrenella longa]|uniref:Antitoxin ParD4 n=1 Tax=Polystyrenella longa TaxID=2528007 RepID=A0A518CNC8_9PLAN|nr:hypothetical protein [Polystyrenella longa]QDU80730.1 hypothetical protein Pla110_24630 [Polystyrenella longa]